MVQVVIDPGHGGTKTAGDDKTGKSSPNNATGPTGLLEKTVTLQVGLETSQALTAAGISVALTRDSDTNLSLSARAGVAKKGGADAFVSIHFNDDKNPKVQGTETWVHTDASQDSLRLAHFVQDAVDEATGYRDRNVKSMKLGVLKPAWHLKKTAACLVEISFMSDPADEKKLKDAKYRAKLGAAIASAIKRYLTAAGKLKVPAVVAAGAGQQHFEDATHLA